MNICCIDKEGTALVADNDEDSIYILEDKPGNPLTKIETDPLLSKPYDATLWNGKLAIVRNDAAEQERILYTIDI